MPPYDSDGYFRWQASDDTPSVAFSRSVMKDIERAVLGAFRPRGPETAGVLLGSRHPETGEFFVDSFEPLPGDSMGQAVQLRSKWSHHLVGVYRTQTRPGLAVSPEDCALVEELLPRHEGVLLLVKPVSNSECIGAFFLCDGGVVVDQAAAQREFALSPGITAHPPPPVAPRRRYLKALLPLTAAAAGIALALFIHAERQHAPDESPAAFSTIPVSTPEAPIALKAVSSGDLIRVSWDPASPSIQTAPDALLTVSDGDRTSSMRLRDSDLRKGTLDWRAATRNVTFQMKVNRPNTTPLTEFARAAPADDPINSSSASALPKPSPLADASAASGEQENPVETGSAAEHAPVRRHVEAPRAQVAQRRQPGRVKRVFGGITSKASHLWPFHSARQE